MKRKYKVGDKVKVKDSLSDVVIAVSDMYKFCGKIVTIKELSGDTSYRIEEDECGWNWDDDCFVSKSKMTQAEIIESSVERLGESLAKTLKERNEELNKTISSSLSKLDSAINQRTIYDDIIQDQVLQKAKDLSLEDIKKELHNDTEKYIKKVYGAIPKKIEIARDGKRVELQGIFHKEFENICKIVESNIPLMLVGGAGAGKNYTLEQVSQALGLTFYTTNAVTQDYKLTGFIDANGKYHETEFYKAFTKGGMFFLDEIDASSPEALIILNGAIANGYFDFPNGRKNAHKDFRVVCAGNTYGTGADMVYVGRNVLDGATLDRFVVLEFDYDDEVEKKLAFDEELYKFIKNLRETINNANLRYIVSMRALINATKLLEIGVPKQRILTTTIVKNMQKDDLNIIVEKLDRSNSWYDEIKRLCD